MATEANKTTERFTGDRRTFTDIISALLKELPLTEVEKLDRGFIQALIPDLRGKSKIPHVISAKINPHLLTSEFDKVDPDSVVIDGHVVEKIEDLEILGLSGRQIDILRNNALVFDRLNQTQERYRSERPKIMNVLEEAFGINIEHNFGQPGNIFNILKSIPQEAAYILTDALGNREGPYSNPLGTTLVGDHCEKYHPIIVGSEEGFLMVPFVKIENEFMLFSGVQTNSAGRAGELLRKGYIPMHPYNFENLLKAKRISDVQFVPSFVLMSKRSVIPVGETFQIKMSLGINITTRNRTIHFPETENAIENTRVLRELGSKNMLPADIFVIGDEGSAQVKGDDNTTHLIRSQFSEFFGNNVQTMPSNAIPITAASLISENVLSPKPLIVDFAEAGFDPVQLGKDIIKKMINTSLDFREIGLIPEMHPQNHIYLIDKENGNLSGIIIRDNEGVKVDVQRLESKSGIKYHGLYNAAIHATSRIPDDEQFKDSFTKYFDRFIITGTLTPLILTLSKHFGASIEELIKFTREIYINWWKSHGKTYEDYEKTISPTFFYANRGLFCLEVKETEFTLMTKRSSHPLIPTHEEMKLNLS